MSEPTAATAPPLLARLGARTRRRAQPRASVALAGAGCGLVVAGALVLSIEGATNGGGGFNRWPGLLLTALVAVSGVLVQRLAPRAPLATAGTVAVVLAVPACITFATLDPGGLTPISPEPILILSTLVYGSLYVTGPGRGRPAYLGAAAVGLWATVLQVAEGAFDVPGRLLGIFLFPVFPFPYLFGLGFEAEYGDGELVGRPLGFDAFDPATAGFLSLAIGVGFVLLSRRLDRQGFAGAATPLLVAAVPALQSAVFLLADELEAAGTGLLVIAIGVGLLVHGASVGRRATTWVGALLASGGVVPIVVDATDDAGVVGVLLLFAGAGFVALATLWHQQGREADEMAVSRRTEPLRAE